jgi:hypothetical protein
MGKGLARTRIHPLRASLQGFLNQRVADASVRAGDQDCFVFDVHNVLLSNHLPFSIHYYASLGGEDTSEAKDFGIGGVTSWLDGGLDSLLLDNNLKLSILSFLFADDTLSDVASEHGPVSFRTECLIPWTAGKSFGLELG